MARSEVIDLLKKYILILNSEGINVSKAFLFGSYSTDTANENSDIDVMIVSDNYDERDDIVIGKIWALTRRVSTKIEPFLIGNKKFSEDNSSPLINMVKEHGIKIA